MRAWRWLLATGLLLLVALALALLVYRARVLPQTGGELRVGGLHGEVSIARDEHGIPTIRGGSEEAVVFGLGFAHAQDRLWQLETHRRIGSGRLAEAFGAAALDNDKFLRALGVRRAAAAQWARLDAASRVLVQAYTDGINGFIAEHLAARPPEFLILGLPVSPWTPEDTLAWSIMMAWDLGGNWSTELLRLRLALRLPPATALASINRLLPPYPGDAPWQSRDYAALYRALRLDGELGAQALRMAPEGGLEGIGSNNWVLAGQRTQSGKPLLANDPHLKLSTPALWYFARLEVTASKERPTWRVAGATMPGLPAVVLGSNERIAWGFTNTNPDVQDLYLEEIAAGDPTRYRTPQGWAAFERYDETITVKGGETVRLTVRASRHGPVISDAEAGATRGLTGGAGAAARYGLALRWTALDADASALPAALALSRAGSVAEFVAAAEQHTAPMQNMLVADVDGHIGFVAAGRVPLRQRDNDLKGLAPAPGWEARYDWAGFLPSQRTPREIDPPRGWIATANQRIHGPDYPHFIGSDWALPYRQQRIESLLAAQPRHSAESLAAIQADVGSLATRRLLPFARAARGSHRLAAAAQERLAAFDGQMHADAAAPMIFAAWARQLARAVFADELGGEAAFDAEVGRRDFRAGLEAVLESDDQALCDDSRTPERESCAQQASRALDRALAEIEAAQGGDMARWAWGKAHQARAEHRPFSKVKWLAPLFELRVPTGGDNYTVNAARYHLKGEEPYLNEHAASLRAVYDLGVAPGPQRARVIHSSGQSGIALSPHYSDFLPRWAAVGSVPLWGAEREVLVLRPRSGAK